MTKQKIIIVDFGGGNLNSVQRTLDKLGVKSVVSRDSKQIKDADKLLLPGVGQFSYGMNSLSSLNLLDTLNELVLVKKKPILGICLGMQLMTNSSEEGNVTGLGWIDAETIRFEITNKVQFKVPHVGWNNLNVKDSNNILHNVSPTDYYYFVHSYYVSCKNESNIMALTDYEYSFASSIQKENIMGVQFHPEKSYEAGEKIFTNFMKL